MREDRRHWILDPAGHRIIWNDNAPEDGETVMTAFGEATMIVPPPPDDNDDWICDMCSEPILTRWGDAPFPVPMLGDYALCLRHFNEAQAWPREDSWGEPIPGTRLGPWPAVGCQCVACLLTFSTWERSIIRAYGLRTS